MGVFAYRRLDDQSWVFVVPVAVLVVLIGAAVRISHQEKQRQSSERPRINWFMWVYLVSVLLMYINGGAIIGGAGQSLELALPGKLGEHGAVYWTIGAAVLAASIFHYGQHTVGEAKAFMAREGIPVRM